MNENTKTRRKIKQALYYIAKASLKLSVLRLQYYICGDIGKATISTKIGIHVKCSVYVNDYITK